MACVFRDSECLREVWSKQFLNWLAVSLSPSPTALLLKAVELTVSDTCWQLLTNTVQAYFTGVESWTVKISDANRIGSFEERRWKRIREQWLGNMRERCGQPTSKMLRLEQLENVVLEVEDRTLEEDTPFAFHCSCITCQFISVAGCIRCQQHTVVLQSTVCESLSSSVSGFVSSSYSCQSRAIYTVDAGVLHGLCQLQTCFRSHCKMY